jgi:hypothetical protein
LQLWFLLYTRAHLKNGFQGWKKICRLLLCP